MSEDDKPYVEIKNQRIDWSTEPNPSFSDHAVVLDMKDMFSVVMACTIPHETMLDESGDEYLRAKVVSSVRMSERGMESFVLRVVNEWNDHVGRKPESERALWHKYEIDCPNDKDKP